MEHRLLNVVPATRAANSTPVRRPGARGRLHVSEVDDGEPGAGAGTLLERYPLNATLQAVVLDQATSRAVRTFNRLIDA